MKKKVIDIYPPHSRRSAEWEDIPEDIAHLSTSAGGRAFFGFPGMLMVLGLGAVVTVPLLLHFFFAKATVHVWPQVTKLEITERAVAQVGIESVGLAKQIVRGQTFEQEKVVSDVFAATGQKEKEERARGTIRVHNTNTGSAQTLVQNTRFISENGQLFRSQERVVVPASSFADVEVLAVEPGEAYNIGPSNFSLPGLVGSGLYTQIYGESSSAMTGGAAKQVAVVVQEDIEKAREELVRRATKEATDALSARVPAGFQVVQDSISSTVLEDDSLVKVGAELDRFNYRVTVRVGAFGFHEGDVNQLARHLVQGYLEPGEEIHENTLAVVPSAQTPGRAQDAIPLLLHIAVDRYDTLDRRSFLQELTGTPRKDFPDVLARHPTLAKAEFSLWPFWIQSIPQDTERITVKLIAEG